MKRLLCVVVVALGCLMVAPCYAQEITIGISPFLQEQEIEDVLRDMEWRNNRRIQGALENSVLVHLTGTDPRNGEVVNGGGGGTYISKNRILTVNHLGMLAEEPIVGGLVQQIWMQDVYFYVGYGFDTPAKVVFYSFEYDMLVLEVEEEHSYARMGTNPGLLAEVLLVGWPRATRVVTTGQIAGITRKGSVLIDAPIQYGFSGGGAFDLDSGKLIGMIYGGWGDELYKLAVITPIEVIELILKEWEDNQ